jgi:hypothetical protein
METVYYQGQRVAPIRVNLHFRFRDDLIVRVDDEFDHWAGMKALSAITKLRLRRTFNAISQSRYRMVVAVGGCLILAWATLSLWKRPGSANRESAIMRNASFSESSNADYRHQGVDFSEGKSVYVAPMRISDYPTFTFEAWVKPIAYGGTILNIDGALTIGSDRRSMVGTSLFIPLNEEEFLLAYSSKNLSRQEWSHVAVTYDGSEIRLFLNGVRQDFETYRFDSKTSDPIERLPEVHIQPRWPDVQLFICGNSLTAKRHEPFQGYIDEVRASRGVRYQNNFQPEHQLIADTSTISLYHFTSERSMEVADESGNMPAARLKSYQSESL